MKAVKIPFARASEFDRRAVLRLGIASALAGGMLIGACVADARTTQIQILSRTTAFGGYSFPGVGQYEVIKGVATGEIDPNNPQNAVITDIGIAPPNPDGNVGYQHNFYILRPLDPSKGNHKVMYEPPNRGGKTFQTLNRSPGGNDPGTTITDPVALANSFLWPQGYTMVFSGWENDLAALNSTTATAHFPVLKNKDGSDITGPGYEYIVTGAASFKLTYPAENGDKTTAKLTHRVHLDDVPQVVPDSGWDYTDATNTSIKLTSGNFVSNDIYEFSYTAKNPTPNGMGLAAIRDFVSFLRYAKQDDAGTPNPLANDGIVRVYSETSSQPGRLLNDFVHLGFNEDESQRKVIDGMLQWIAAGDGDNMNYRWSQTGRTNRNRQDLLYLEGLFPFANPTTFDPISGDTDGRYRKCSETNTCPLAMEFYSSNEYWVKAGSLMSTDPTGSYDLPDQPEARLYLLSSKQHGGAGNPASKGSCQQFLNPLDSAQVQRALWQDLDDWSTKGIAPPASRVPRLDDGTLVPVPDPALTNFHYVGIPSVTYTGLKTTRYRLNYGPDFYPKNGVLTDKTYIPTINPPVITPPYEDNPANGPIYRSYVPKYDSDGNEIAGIRLPELTVPLATYTGWGLRSGPQANDGCESSGQYIPFESTKAERVAAGDPRPSVEERYKSFGQYRSAVVNAIDDMVKNRLMLCSDAGAYVQVRIDAGLAAGVPAPKGNEPRYPGVPHCN
ncbi:MAG TPA: alpha/beta hydrolase domain-containing protein [Casimicrobiaceae bacterium]